MSDRAYRRTHPGSIWLTASVGIPTAAGACFSALVGGAMLLSPASPLALGRADAMLGRGMPIEAIGRYEAIAAASPFISVRRSALRRAARVYELDLDQPKQARRALKLLLAQGVDAPEEGDIREALGELYMAERDHAAAAQQYRQAYDADPSRPERLVRAAELRAEEGDFPRSMRLWNRVMEESPEYRDRASLARGEIWIARGKPASALSSYQDAARSENAEIASVARLGLATCYERLGELDGALAQLDQAAALPEHVRERRVNALRERQAIRDK